MVSQPPFLSGSLPEQLILISIITAGIILGVGRAVGYRRVERFGMEELLHSIINAALWGGFAIVTATLTGIATSFRESVCRSNAVLVDEVACVMENEIKKSVFSLFQEIIKVMINVGYYQSLQLNMGFFSIQPLINLEGLSQTLASHIFLLQIILILVDLNIQIVTFISQQALTFLALGLLFRMLFLTRTIGGFLIAMGIGFYTIYPAFMLLFLSPSTGSINSSFELQTALNQTKNFTANVAYASVPIIDLNNNMAIAQKLDVLSNRSNSTRTDLSNDLTKIVQADSNAISKVFFYAVIAPILSFVLTLLFIKELGSLLGSEIGMGSISNL